MRFKQFILAVIAAGTIGSGMTSCTSKFDDYNTDQNATTTVTPGMLATNLIIGMMDMGGSKYSVYDNMRNKQIAWAEGSAENDQYNLFGRASFDSYTDLTNCQKMLLEAASATEEVQNSYKGLAKFFKAHHLFYLSMQVGDIPYSQSNQAEEGRIYFHLSGTRRYPVERKFRSRFGDDSFAEIFGFILATSGKRLLLRQSPYRLSGAADQSGI